MWKRIFGVGEGTLPFAGSGTVFALLRWTQADCGAATCCIDIVRAPLPGEPRDRLPFVPTGGERLLHGTGWPQVRMVLEAIDRIERQRIDPARIDSAYWREVAERLRVGAAIHAYAPSRHHAWQARRATS
ncbi:DUF2840 domain-containing protein [Gluconacetobacter azotocaptans]|uniref:DUF2840 domain-containing protein n=1 Tax=Gluconacetobacter azotocaptans TaxID=142834 RepID=UPI001F038C2B|nr:DUF2840 domain-containing protein [Gluconacetobacter azotocaptans]